MVEVVSRFATRDRAVDVLQVNAAMTLDAGSRRFYTEATDFMTIDGIVRKTALEATKGADLNALYVALARSRFLRRALGQEKNTSPSRSPTPSRPRFAPSSSAPRR